MNLLHNIYVILAVVTQAYRLATGVELKEMAQHRLEESELLYNNGYHAGSYYMAGYAIEFGLKSIICKKLGVDIFENGRVSGSMIKSFQVHDINALILLSGLQPELEAKKAGDLNFSKAWNGVSAWTEQRRYDYGCNPETAAKFLKRVNEFMQWIETHW
ncbi:hypothetical protein DYBT9623_05534 [Dyadobacter sp. CECT 9623]|uniref:HEPN domain-containing protein n=1 Tax=Dyadobacter linearis TaxID=2823330 RepID=A0ABM8UZ27_9BACT|nr:HEPN domain-containing protein [Dyadobacter sp. CECT 9623]CAG5074993.1 hypothetical protein DYBT9623_05534 [Dyadobacter sp. CECT 9623]